MVLRGNGNLVSVIIPTCNRAGSIVRAVTSVLEQTLQDLEVIVVDDGSTDGTLDLLGGIADSRLQVLSQSNKGVSAARNLGLATAQGRFLALLDSDDHWRPQKAARQVRFMIEGGFHLSQTDEIWIRNGVRVNPRRKHAKPAGWFLEKSLHMCLISPSCVMFTREFLGRYGMFDETLPACEDYDLWLRAGISCPAGFLPEPLVVKTGGHADQLSRKILGLDLYRIYAMVKQLRSENPGPEHRRMIRRALRARSDLYIKGCLKRGRFTEAQRIRSLVEEALALSSLPLSP
jgi:glycosyltransferase involved in cell wall biosynthesis